MRKQAKEWRQEPGRGRIGLIAFVVLSIGISFLKVEIHDYEKENAVLQTTTVPTTELHIEVDENGKPTPESLKKLEESKGMEEYYKWQMDQAEKQMMFEPENDGFTNQPY